MKSKAALPSQVPRLPSDGSVAPPDMAVIEIVRPAGVIWPPRAPR